MGRRNGKLRVACIGTGYFSRFHYDGWRRIPEVELAASVSLDFAEAKNTGLPAYSSVLTMLQEQTPDLVDIITPPASHFEIIKTCADKGVGTIICQKPFCNSLKEAREAAVFCEKQGIRLIVHENFRFQPWYRVMKQAIENQVLGELHQLTFRLRTGDGQGPQAYLDRQPYFQQMERFLIRETGIHWLDTFCFLLGNPKSVYADLRKMNPHIAGEDAGYFILEFENGLRALFDANRHLDHDADNCRTTLGEAILEGSQGTIMLNGSGEVSLRKFGSREYQMLLETLNWQGFGGDCVYALQSHVVAAIIEGAPIENAAREYIAILELEEAVYESAKTGAKITL